MPSFGDTAIIALLALLLFGPKKLPELARQLGKLMGEFRRASNEFRMQMEDELRISEQEDQAKKIAALQAATPAAQLEEEHPVLDNLNSSNEVVSSSDESEIAVTEQSPIIVETPLPIASAGEIDMMPPATGLPVGRSTLSPVLDSIPQIQSPETTAAELPVDHHDREASLHG